MRGSQTVEITIEPYHTNMRSHVGRAASGQAAEAFTSSSNERAIEVALDVDQMTYEVNTFLIAASMISRLGRS